MPVYNHTGQVVTDLERSKRFYQEVFGFRVLVRDPAARRGDGEAQLPRSRRSASPRRT